MTFLSSLADTQAPAGAEHEDVESLGERLRRLRLATGCTIGEIAAVVGINRELLRSFERDREEPSNGALKRLARVYGVSLEDLSPTAAGPGGRSSER